MKKLLLTFLLGMGMTLTVVAGYATVTYVLDKVVEQSVTVGETVLYTDGLIIELVSYDPYTLTFFDLEETESSKHYITYTYNYTILVEGVNIEVSSITDDIAVTGITSTETTISITFSLNQEKEFNEGDILNIQFYFEAVEISLGGFTVNNPININTATEAELYAIGLSEVEVNDTITERSYAPFNSVSDWSTELYVSSLVDRYHQYEDLGIIIFN